MIALGHHTVQLTSPHLVQSNNFYNSSMDSTNEFNILNSVSIFLGCVCSGAEGFLGKIREKPDSDYEIEPRVFPLVSDANLGTAFIFKDSNSKSHVVSWPSEVRTPDNLHNGFCDRQGKKIVPYFFT